MIWTCSSKNIKKGGTLEIELGPEPNKQWGVE